jgi:hypothetical protein
MQLTGVKNRFDKYNHRYGEVRGPQSWLSKILTPTEFRNQLLPKPQPSSSSGETV